MASGELSLFHQWSANIIYNILYTIILYQNAAQDHVVNDLTHVLCEGCVAYNHKHTTCKCADMSTNILCIMSSVSMEGASKYCSH
jgi:hypothetical protein